MKKSFLSALAALVLFSCGPKESATINVDIQGAGSKEVVLSKLYVNQIKVLDTLKLDSKGAGKYTVAVGEQTPDFFYLSYNRKRLASLVLKGGDKVSVSVDTLGQNLVVNGSDESVRLAEIEGNVHSFTAKFDSLSYELVSAVEAKDAKKADELQYALGRHFIKYKRAAIAEIMKNPYSFSNVTLMYQKLNENLPLFGEITDVAYFKRVADSLKSVYPNSVYVKSLEEEALRLENVMALNNRIKAAEELAYPELSLPDTQAQTQKLSKLLGKPFVLVFWTSTNAEQKMFNHDLKEIYKKYSPKGLQIYQVSADVDKAAWATVVKEQELPWINVCDGFGAQSLALQTYGIQKLPSMFIFDKEGTIVAKDKFNKAALDNELSKLSF
jgi:peroxiredoxin